MSSPVAGFPADSGAFIGNVMLEDGVSGAEPLGHFGPRLDDVSALVHLTPQATRR